MSEMFIDEVQNNFFHLLASFPVQDFKCQSKVDGDHIIELSAMTYFTCFTSLWIFAGFSKTPWFYCTDSRNTWEVNEIIERIQRRSYNMTQQ